MTKVIFFVGPLGSGKTYRAEQLAKGKVCAKIEHTYILNHSVMIADIVVLIIDEYVPGDKADKQLRNIINLANFESILITSQHTELREIFADLLASSDHDVSIVECNYPHIS